MMFHESSLFFGASARFLDMVAKLNAMFRAAQNNSLGCDPDKQRPATITAHRAAAAGCLFFSCAFLVELIARLS